MRAGPSAAPPACSGISYLHLELMPGLAQAAPSPCLLSFRSWIMARQRRQPSGDN